MSLLEDKVTLKGLKGTTTVTALFDSGASYSCIKRSVAENVAVLEPLEEPMEFALADENAFVTADYVIHLSFYFQDTDRRFTDEFIVLDSLSEDLIVGAKTMQSWKIRLDFDKEEILYDRKMHKLRL
jgi:hypothetical protein